MGKFESEESAFNFAVEYLRGISNSLKMCEQSAAIGNMDGWIHWLRISFRQLSAKTNPKEDKEFDDAFKEINILINDPIKRKKQRTLIFYKLDKLESKIRKRLQTKGMLLPSKADPRFAVLQR